MAERAHVDSLEALERFRASLIVYLAKARPVFDEVRADLIRMRLWLETDQRLRWEREVRRRTRQLEEAQQALFSARLSTFRKVTVSEQGALQKARRALAEAEDKLRRVKKWAREFGPRTESLVRQFDALDTFLARDMSQAVVWMTQAVKNLDAYAEVRPSPVPGGQPVASAGENSGDVDRPMQGTQDALAPAAPTDPEAEKSGAP